MLITSEQHITAEKQHERNEEWYDQECRETIEVKREARLNLIQRSTTPHQEDYNIKRIAAAKVSRKKKTELLKTKFEEILEYHTKNGRKKYYKRILETAQEFKRRVNAFRNANGKILPEIENIQ
jgi:hypothetical protein